MALPFSYTYTDKRYPVLWVMDNDIEASIPVLAGGDLILVGVGAPPIEWREWGMRRAYDFTPTEELFFGGPGGDYLRQETAKLRPEFLQAGAAGGAARFLEFLVEDVRPLLASEYRMDPLDHGLFGFSQGGTFVGYTLFTRPGAFARYICGSPALNSSNHRIFELEQEYAAKNADLPVSVFFGAGSSR